MIVVKFGGHAMTDAHGDFAEAISEAVHKGIQIVIVHGGGPQISAALSAAAIESEFIGGFRVTTPEIFEIVEQVLTHEVGPAIANSLLKIGVNAVAISGRTSESLIAEPQRKLVDGTPADLGLVGVITAVNPQAIRNALKGGQVPVISPIAIDENFRGGLNVNADIAAAAIAGALDASVLIIMTDVAGIYRNWPDKSSLIDEISAIELSEIKNVFSEGMAPKVQSCLDAIAAGAQAVRIIDGTDPKSFALALNNAGGTLVTK
ncbi:MAG: acetylglutamate kinase [Candidatus Planktophila sp.]|nr:acetylglutamate kinase [Candidatus Planktophila sp.]